MLSETQIHIARFSASHDVYICNSLPPSLPPLPPSLPPSLPPQFQQAQVEKFCQDYNMADMKLKLPADSEGSNVSPKVFNAADVYPLYCNVGELFGAQTSRHTPLFPFHVLATVGVPIPCTSYSRCSHSMY